MNFVPEFGDIRAGAKVIALAVLPVSMIGLLFGLFMALASGWDIHVFWQAGRDVLEGHNPYPPANEAILSRGESFVYPAGTLLGFVPLALLPFPVAKLVVLIALFAAPAVALRLLEVRDVRCYGAAYASPAVAASFSPGAISPLLLLGVALLWRFRDRLWAASVLAAAVVCAKVFLWPLLVWLVATRRTSAALAAAMIGSLLTLAAWAAIGFAGFTDYPRLLIALSNALQATSNSAVGLALSLGLSADWGHVLAALAGALALSATVFVARRPDGDRVALAGALAAAFLLSPIIRMHYFGILLVPIALYRPRLSAIWAAPLLLWLAYLRPVGHAWHIGVSVAVLFAVYLATGLSRSWTATRPVAP